MSEEKLLKADEQFEDYNFGEDVVIVACESWDTEDSDDYIRVAYAEIEDVEDSVKISFHVNFDSVGNVVDSYAYGCESGIKIGTSKVQ